MTESNVSDEVEAAAKALYEDDDLWSASERPWPARDAEIYRRLAASALSAAAKVRAIREGDGEYVPHVIRYDSAEAGDPYWEFIDADTVAVIAPMRAANVELMYDLVDRSKVIGMRVYDAASPIPATGGEKE